MPAAQAVSGTVYALDIDPDMVAAAQAQIAAAGLSNVVVEIRDFAAAGCGRPDASVGYVMLFNILHIENPVSLLREAYRVLVPGGRVGVIHWKQDSNTRRGPSLPIRPRPEQCREWAEQAGLRFVRFEDLGCCSWHWGIVLERPHDSGPHQSLVQQQFNRQASHYGAGSAMADCEVLNAILEAAPVDPGQRVLDVACGAGLLLRAYRDAGADVFGVDLSDAMLRAARRTLSPDATDDHLLAGDIADLPFDSQSFDLVTCKLAFHYFPNPQRAIEEMSRVCRSSGRVVLVDRVAADDLQLCEAQNRLEKLRTPNKIRVYSERELTDWLAACGLSLLHRAMILQPMDFEEWMSAAGATDRLGQARSLVIGPHGEDLTGLAPRGQAGRLVIQHRTLILVARSKNLVCG